MNYDLPPPPPYSLRISKAVVLDRDDSLIKGMDEMASSIREVTTQLGTIMIEILRAQNLDSSLEAMKECNQLWGRCVSGIVDAAQELKTQVLDEFNIVANQTGQTSYEELREILNYINSQVFVKRNGNEVTALLAKLDFTIASLQPNAHPESNPDTAPVVKREEKDRHSARSLIVPAKLVLPPVYLLIVWRYYAHFLDKINLDKINPKLPWRWNPEHVRTHFLLYAMAPVMGLYTVGVVRFISGYKRTHNHSVKNKGIEGKIDQPNNHSKRIQIINSIEEAKSKVNASVRTLDIIQRIFETVKEDVKDHLEVINRSDFEDAEKRTEILDGLKLSNDLYCQISLAIFRLNSLNR